MEGSWGNVGEQLSVSEEASVTPNNLHEVRSDMSAGNHTDFQGHSHFQIRFSKIKSQVHQQCRGLPAYPLVRVFERVNHLFAIDFIRFHL